MIPWWRYGLIFASLALLFIFIPKTLVWADESKPGDLLYPVDRLLEQMTHRFVKESEYAAFAQKLLEERAVEFDRVAGDSTASVGVQDTVVANLIEEPPNEEVGNLNGPLEQRRSQIIQKRLDRLETLINRTQNVHLKNRYEQLTQRYIPKEQPDHSGLEIPPKPTLKPSTSPAPFTPAPTPIPTAVPSGDASAQSSSEVEVNVNEIEINLEEKPLQFWQQRIKEKKNERWHRWFDEGSESESKSSIQIEGQNEVKIEIGE